MKKIIIIKYGELSTKKDNISFFIKTLKTNIEDRLKSFKYELNYDHGRMYITTEYYDEVVAILKNTFGIHEFNIGYEINDTDINIISENLIKLLEEKNFKTFKVITKRSNKNYPLNSMEISSKLGGIILSKLPNVKVDVHKPELEINLEIRKNNAYLYFEKIKGIGGYPVGTLGKGLLMLSGGIDSPVAGYLALKRGIRIECIYFDSPPHTSKEALNKVLALATNLSNYSGYIKIHVIPFTKIQEEIYKNCSKEYMITIMRRMMYRISESIAYKNHCKVIINGENVGQVASQTLTSIACINEVIKMPVLRPVCCFDKLEIIDIAKKINTYETSILPYEDCCTIFVPEHPVINPNVIKVLENESLIQYMPLIKEAIKNDKVIRVPINNQFTDIL
jgi:tRNA uracil 4-sulfurtransferase